jgi:hypothetical protein
LAAASSGLSAARSIHPDFSALERAAVPLGRSNL